MGVLEIWQSDKEQVIFGGLVIPRIMPPQALLFCYRVRLNSLVDCQDKAVGRAISPRGEIVATTLAEMFLEYYGPDH